MQLDPKIEVLAEYLGLDSNDEEQINEIKKVEDNLYVYFEDVYKVLTKSETEDEINICVNDIISGVNWEINNVVDLTKHYDNGYYMQVIVNEDLIQKQVKENFSEYIGIGTYEEFNKYNIFLM